MGTEEEIFDFKAISASSEYSFFSFIQNKANNVVFSKVIFNSLLVTISNNLSWNVIDEFK